SSATSPRKARSTRARISAAARRVKVIARICSGSSTTASSRSSLCVRTVVLPDPAGACRMTERSGSIARSRARSSACAAARPSGLASLLVIHPPRAVLEAVIIDGDQRVADTAHACHVAEVAGSRLRVDRRLASGEGPGQPLNQTAPFAYARVPGVLRVSLGALHTSHFWQQRLARSDAVEPDLSCRDVDRRQRNDILANSREIREELRMRRPIAIPVGSGASAALVVENCETAALERIEAIDAQTQLLAGEAKPCRVFRVPHAKRRAPPLDREELADEPQRAAALPRQRRGGDRALAGGLERGRGAPDARRQQLLEPLRGERQQCARVAETLPELLQRGVQELPARIGRNARFRHTELQASQAQLRISTKRTLILQLETARSG